MMHLLRGIGFSNDTARYTRALLDSSTAVVTIGFRTHVTLRRPR